MRQYAVKFKAKNAESACDCVPERQRELEERYETIKAGIEAMFCDYHKALDSTKEGMLQKLEKLRDDQENDLNNLNRRVNVTTAKIADAVAWVF